MPEYDKTHVIEDLESLKAIYGEPPLTSLAKELDYIHPHYRAFIEASPFVALATSGPGGLDATPRGDAAGFIVVEDEKTLLLPDRRGNNRIDSLRNIVADPRVALLFLIPGSGNTLRVNGRAVISVDPALLERFAVQGKQPRSMLVVTVEAVYFQCSRAILRSDLWNPEKHLDRDALPSVGTILADLSEGQIDGGEYDREWPERAKKTMY
ncbi:MAG: pyridoxamine 5'-phosphate oxidase family protein [Proteobacteria bacterium]|nr:pyridoxamine 5'-phosphate oxidase family protein [Pseudomonadota bacterium]